MTAVKNKIPDVTILVKKTSYDAKILDIEKKVTDHDHDKYITISEFNKLTTENFKARLAQANLVTKTDFEAKFVSLNKKINSNKTKHLLVENEFKNYNLIRVILNYFGDNGTQNYLVFQPIQKYLKKLILMIIFQHGNLKDCLMKVLELLMYLILFLILYYIMLVLRQ